MWILLNNSPIQAFDITNVSKIYESTFDKLVSKAGKDPKDFPVYFFIVNGAFNSIKYKTYQEAEEVRDNLLLIINTIEASLPKINI